MVETLSWTGKSLRLLDQTRLPCETVYVELTDSQQVWDAIRRLVVRGAPAIGVAAAFGAYLGVRGQEKLDAGRLLAELDKVCEHLATSRPTAVNLRWALHRIQQVARSVFGNSTSLILQTILSECLTLLEEDRQACRRIGEEGLKLLDSMDRKGSRTAADPLHVLTHCNAGALATTGLGTALAPIYVGVEQHRRFHVFADETRPLLQGSRITAYELLQSDVPVTVLCDNMAASLMSGGAIDVVLVGADRIAANGDAANKIGTLGVAILARHFSIPFFIAAPTSTIDHACNSGQHIPIEHRDPREVIEPFGRAIAPTEVAVFNPAFDVTPANLIDAIITDRGVARPPFVDSLHKLAG